MNIEKKYPFNVEWLPKNNQRYHGPRKRMREMHEKYDLDESEVFTQTQVITFLMKNYAKFIPSIMKLKFYQITDKNRTLRFFILWCDYNAEAREHLFEDAGNIISQTGWYPMITGHRVFHHGLKLVDYMDTNLKKAMNKTNIKSLPGLGHLQEIVNLSKGEGTSIIIKTSTYDIVLDAGMSIEDLQIDQFRSETRKWLFLSHSHHDHIGGLATFVKNKKFVISGSPLTLEFILLKITSNGVKLSEYFPKDFFYRFAPMWYRSLYNFSDGSSIETFPTYHYPGSMGFLFTFSNGETLFYSGDLNISSSYLLTSKKELKDFASYEIGLPSVDFGLFDGAFIGRKIGSESSDGEEILKHLELSLLKGRNHLMLTPPFDYGLFLYLHLYYELISNSDKLKIAIFLDSNIIRQLEILEWRLKRKRKGELDDALIDFLKARKTLAESVRIFDIEKNFEKNIKYFVDNNVPIVLILDDSKLNQESYIQLNVLTYVKQVGLDISRIGKASTKRTSDYIMNLTVKDFDGGNWLLHSQEQLLKNYFLYGNQKYKQVYIFHNYKKRIQHFVKLMKEEGYTGKISHL